MDDLIQLDRISRTFGSHQALREVSLRLQPGRIGLLGPNGAGKSTLLKILMGLLAPSSGSGRVLDRSFQAGDQVEEDYELRRLIGFMPEADALVPGLRGIDYVALAGEMYGLPRKQAIRRSHEVLTYLGLEEARYRKLEEYSTGMKQRLKLAQAVVHDPPLLLLDEPTSGLDPASRDAMLRLLLEMGRDFGKSFLLSTHLLADVEAVCEQVVILMDGQVRGQGTVRDLCRRRQDRYVVRAQGNLEEFGRSLENHGVRVLHKNAKGEYRVAVSDGWQAREFFALAAGSACVIRGILPDDESLEEMFLRTALAPNPAA